MLNLSNISKKFGDIEVLRDISFSINKGEIISLLGQSGSGKSTVLNIIAGFEELDSGSCTYDSQRMCDTNIFIEPQNRNIGFVFQNYALFPHLSIAKNILFGVSHLSKKDQANTLSKLINLLNLHNLEKKFPHEISGGQQQRVAIARVLARDTQLILFDESFSSIDSLLKSKLLVEIKDILRQSNKTAIFVTHSPKEALELSDKIAYMENGKIIQFGTPKDLIQSPVSESVTQALKY